MIDKEVLDYAMMAIPKAQDIILGNKHRYKGEVKFPFCCNGFNDLIFDMDKEEFVRIEFYKDGKKIAHEI
jgi:hypothetical protein